MVKKEELINLVHEILGEFKALKPAISDYLKNIVLIF
jgi:hypothetical protein